MRPATYALMMMTTTAYAPMRNETARYRTGWVTLPLDTRGSKLPHSRDTGYLVRDGRYTGRKQILRDGPMDGWIDTEERRKDP